MAAGDFDDDGDQDIAVATSTQLLLLSNDGDGLTFSQVGAIPVSISGGAQLVVAELNGDGIDDLLLVDGIQAERISFAGGALNSEGTWPHNAASPMPTSGDIDGDGDEDVVIFDAARYEVWRRSGANSFVTEGAAIGGPAAKLADVDGDGDLDGICCGGNGGNVLSIPLRTFASPFRISLNDGQGRFAPAFLIPGVGSDEIAGARDVDLDGDVDLIGGRAIYYASGPITGYGMGACAAPSAGAVFDLEGDGDPDLDTSLAGTRRNDGAGGFSSFQNLKAALPTGESYVGPGYPGDWDGDGSVELIVEHHVAGVFSGMRWLEERGGHWYDVGPAAVPGLRFHSSGDMSADAAIAVDLDDDGWLDLVTRSRSGAYQSQVWLGNGATLVQGPQYAGEVVVAAADLDGNGLCDLVVSDGSVRIRWGQAQGFSPSADLVAPFLTPNFNDPGIFDPHQDSVVLLDHWQDGRPELTLWRRGPAIDRLYTVSWVPQIQAMSYSTSGYFGASVELSSSVSGPRRVFSGQYHESGDFVALTPCPDVTDGVFLRRMDVVGLAGRAQLVMSPEAFADVDGDGDDDAFANGMIIANRQDGGRGDRLQYGAGTAGGDGIVPTLGIDGPLRAGESTTIRLRGGLGGAPFFYIGGVAPADIDFGLGLRLHVQSPVEVFRGILGGPAGLPGAGQFDLNLPPLPAALIGVGLYGQFSVLDSAGPFGIATSNGMKTTFAL